MATNTLGADITAMRVLGVAPSSSSSANATAVSCVYFYQRDGSTRQLHISQRPNEGGKEGQGKSFRVAECGSLPCHV